MYREYHEIRVPCSKEQAYTAARNLDFSKSKIIKTLFKIRCLPTKDLTLVGFSNRVKFTFLEEIENDEFIIGFWANYSVEKILDRDQFIVDNESRRLKVVWNFKVDPIENGWVVVSTETRIYCRTIMTKIFFSLYWVIIRPFSGLIRRKMLEIIKENIEHDLIKITSK